jgi:hypothetical protein
MNVPGRGTNGGTKLRPKGHQFVQSVQFVEIAKSLAVTIFGEQNEKNPAPHEGAGHSQGERRLLVIGETRAEAVGRLASATILRNCTRCAGFPD